MEWVNRVMGIKMFPTPRKIRIISSEKMIPAMRRKFVRTKMTLLRTL
jgi:hypothetical protein